MTPVKATWWLKLLIWHPAAENFLGNKVSLLVNYLSYEPDSALKMGGNEMHLVDDVTDLVVTIDSKLRLTIHINRIFAKAF